MSEGRDPFSDFEIINRELSDFSEKLAQCPQIVVLNKSDMICDAERAEEFRNYLKEQSYNFVEISAYTGNNLKQLVYILNTALSDLPPVTVYEAETSLIDESELQEKSNEIKITKYDGLFVVEGDWLRRVMLSVNFDDYESLQYFQRVLRVSGVIDKLREEEMCIRDRSVCAPHHLSLLLKFPVP